MRIYDTLIGGQNTSALWGGGSGRDVMIGHVDDISI